MTTVASVTHVRVGVKHTLATRLQKSTRNQYASPPWGNAIPAGPLSDFDEILCRWWIPKSSVLLSKILTLSV